MSVKQKGLVMRLAIFVSLALALGAVSFGASACSNTNEYNNKMTEVQQKYKLNVAAAKGSSRCPRLINI
jgi:hypothetical protein